jgi:hypothetical protein
MSCFTCAPLFLGEGVAVDAAGDLCLADTGQRQVRKVSPDRSVCLVIVPLELSWASGLAGDAVAVTTPVYPPEQIAHLPCGPCRG